MNRSSARRVSPAVWLLAAAALALAVLVAAWLLGPKLTAGAKPAGLVLIAVLVLGGGVFGCLHWRGLDETAREAHKSAWFWGGSFGLAFISLALVALMFAPGSGDALADYANANRGHIHPTTFAILMGFLACCLAQMVGYALAWGRWWLKRRG